MNPGFFRIVQYKLETLQQSFISVSVVPPASFLCLFWYSAHRCKHVKSSPFSLCSPKSTHAFASNGFTPEDKQDTFAHINITHKTVFVPTLEIKSFRECWQLWVTPLVIRMEPQSAWVFTYFIYHLLKHPETLQHKCPLQNHRT